MPNNWKTYKLAEVANLVTGFAFKSKFYENDGDLRVIRGKNITEGYLRWGDDARFWNHSLEKLERYTVQEDDIVIGMDGSKIGKNRAIIRKHDLPAILAQRVAMVRAKDGRAEQKYLWQLINNSPFENYVENVKTGTSIPHISLGQVGNFEIILPSLPEQQAIASILSSLDDKIELNLQMNKTLEEMAMTLYKHWFVDFGPFKDGEFVDSELGLIPEGWEVKSIGEFVDILNSKRVPLSSAQRSSRQGEYPYYGASGIIDYIDDYVFDGEHVIISEDGENLRSRKTPIAFMAHGQFWVNNHAHILKGRVNGINELLIHHFKQLDLNPYLTGAVQPKLNKQNLLFISLPVPNSLTLLEPVLNEFYSLSRIVLNNIQENQTLTTLRDTLLPKLISGEVRVKEAEQSLASIM